MSSERSILVLLPFLVRGAMSLTIVREMRSRGLREAVAAFERKAQNYTGDDLVDLRDTGDFVDLSTIGPSKYLETLLSEIRDRSVGLILQIGAPAAYRLLPYIREACPNVQIVDTLYNEVGHTVNHFLYEASIDGVIVESQYMRGFVEKNTLIAAPNIDVLESGIDLSAFIQNTTRPVTATIAVGYVGRMSSEKNPVGFVEMAESLAPRHPSLTFYMFGEGEQASQVRDRIKDSRMGARIKYEGYVADVKTALQCLDILMVPSLFDGRPNIVMEANACSVPVIGAPVGGLPEMIVPGQNGYVVDPKDIPSLSEIFSEFEQQPAKLQKLRDQSRATARAQFDRVSMMKRYEDLFQRYLSMSSRKSGSPGLRRDVLQHRN